MKGVKEQKWFDNFWIPIQINIKPTVAPGERTEKSEHDACQFFLAHHSWPCARLSFQHILRNVRETLPNACWTQYMVCDSRCTQQLSLSRLHLFPWPSPAQTAVWIGPVFFGVVEFFFVVYFCFAYSWKSKNLILLSSNIHSLLPILFKNCVQWKQEKHVTFLQNTIQMQEYINKPLMPLK